MHKRTVGVVYAQFMSRPARTSPRERSVDWPQLTSTDPSAEVARRFAQNLKIAIGDSSLRASAQLTDVDHSTIQSILQGRAWPDLETIAKLERGFATVLWPGLAIEQDQGAVDRLA